ncbi:MAG: YIP1 family protein [Rhodobacteraceae bacterium]|nr:YIP1 family protein [Paracoccaceae bacterium]
MYFAVLVSRFAEAFAQPRQSARRILAAKPSLGDALTMAIAGMTISVMLSLLTALFATVSEDIPALEAEPVEQQPIVVLLFFVALFAVARFFMVSWLALVIGRRAGGTATLHDCYAVVGWCLLAVSPVTLIFELAAPAAQKSGDLFAFMVLIGGAIYVLYMFASFIAEAHGFKNTGQVMAAMIGVAFAAAFIMTLLMQMAGVRIET